MTTLAAVPTPSVETEDDFYSSMSSSPCDVEDEHLSSRALQYLYLICEYGIRIRLQAIEAYHLPVYSPQFLSYIFSVLYIGET